MHPLVLICVIIELGVRNPLSMKLMTHRNVCPRLPSRPLAAELSFSLSLSLSLPRDRLSFSLPGNLIIPVSHIDQFCQFLKLLYYSFYSNVLYILNLFPFLFFFTQQNCVERNEIEFKSISILKRQR